MCAFFSAQLVIGQNSNVRELPPINELGSEKFMGKTGGLYPGGSNEMPESFYNDAITMAESIAPLSSNGNPDENGKIGMISIGASTVAMFGKSVESLIYNVPGINNNLTFVNGGVGGQDLNKIADQNGRYWSKVDQEVINAGLTNEQIQVMWFQEDDLRNTTSAFPERADMLVESFIWHIQQMKKRYPNLKLLYLTGRHTTDYMPAKAKEKHREPRAYLNGWACKWVIEEQINGNKELTYMGEDAKSPLILWGPYFWTQGDITRKDGYSFTPDMVKTDGVHPNTLGEIKVANDLLDFWKADPVSSIWLTGEPAIAVVDRDILSIDVQGQVIKTLYADELEQAIQLMVLKNEEVLKNEVYELSTEAISLNDLAAGMHTILLFDHGDYVERIEVETDASGNLIKDDAAIDEVENENTGQDAPAWLVNGNNKLNKLKRLLGQQGKVKAVIYDLGGNEVLVIDDVLNQYTNLNEMVGRGKFLVKFFDEAGERIQIEEGIPERVKLK